MGQRKPVLADTTQNRKHVNFLEQNKRRGRREGGQGFFFLVGGRVCKRDARYWRPVMAFNTACKKKEGALLVHLRRPYVVPAHKQKSQCVSEQ